MISDGSKVIPMDIIIKILGKKWSISLIKDMIAGKKQFKEFLNENEGLTNKILALRLKELEDVGLIEKNVCEYNNRLTEYTLTENGRNVNFIYELGNYLLSNSEKK